MKRSYRHFIARKKVQYGEKFDSSALSKKFIRYFETGQRIEVDFGCEVKRGTVGVTTGWRPVFLLILRRNSTGSIYTLSDNNKIVKEVN